MFLSNFQQKMTPQLIAAKKANVPFVLVHLDEFQKFGSLPTKPATQTASNLFSELQNWFDFGSHGWVLKKDARELDGYRPKLIFLLSGNVFPRSAVQTKDDDTQVSDQIKAIMGKKTYSKDGSRGPNFRNIIITYLPSIEDAVRLMETAFNNELLPQLITGVNGNFLAGLKFSVSSDFFKLLAKYGRMADVSQDSGARGVLGNMSHMREEIVRCLHTLPLCPGSFFFPFNTRTHNPPYRLSHHLYYYSMSR